MKPLPGKPGGSSRCRRLGRTLNECRTYLPERSGVIGPRSIPPEPCPGTNSTKLRTASTSPATKSAQNGCVLMKLMASHFSTPCLTGQSGQLRPWQGESRVPIRQSSSYPLNLKLSRGKNDRRGHVPRPRPTCSTHPAGVCSPPRWKRNRRGRGLRSSIHSVGGGRVDEEFCRARGESSVYGSAGLPRRIRLCTCRSVKTDILHDS